MSTVLITAFEPYGEWPANSSWLTLQELTKDLPTRPKLITRLYPVDFQATRDKLARDLAANPDFALHLGQAPGSAKLRLEAIGLNVASEPNQPADQHQPLVADGPAAYRSSLPLAAWTNKLRAAGIPACVSYHAGTYLCNATLYLSHHLTAEQNLKTKSVFIHLPLEVSQTAADSRDLPALPVAANVQALRLILEELAS